MKYKLGLFTLLGLFSSGGFCRSDSVCINYPGALICENGRIKNIDGTYGSVIIDNVEVNGVLKGNIGTVNIKKSKINQITGNIGSFIADKALSIGKIEGNIGMIQFKSSSIGEINVHSPSLHIDGSNIEKIIVSSTEKRIKIRLNNKSVVNGDISFSKNDGDVCIDQTSEVKRNIINGRIIRGSC